MAAAAAVLQEMETEEVSNCSDEIKTEPVQNPWNKVYYVLRIIKAENLVQIVQQTHVIVVPIEIYIDFLRLHLIPYFLVTF